MKNRADRIAEAQRWLDEVTPAYEKAKAVYDRAQQALDKAKRSFDPGEKVRVHETCRRGCCTEFNEVGEIVNQTENGNWVVRFQGEDGKTFTKLCFDPERVR